MEKFAETHPVSSYATGTGRKSVGGEPTRLLVVALVQGMERIMAGGGQLLKAEVSSNENVRLE